MTEQDKQALIKHFCSRDCGEAAEGCMIMPCHEIELIQEFPTTEADSDTISRQAAIETVMECYDNDELFEVYEDKLRELPPAQPNRGKWEMGIDERFVKCSECGLMTTRNELRGLAVFGKNEPNFCPNCGADMREVTT